MIVTRYLFLFLLLAVTVLLTSSAIAEQSSAIVIESAQARPNPPVVPNGAAYMTITNTAAEADRLLTISGEIARTIQLHETSNTQGVMKMQHLNEGIAIAADATIKLEPGGLHIMLMGLQDALKPGNSFPLTLHFANAGAVTVNIQVKDF